MDGSLRTIRTRCRRRWKEAGFSLLLLGGISIPGPTVLAQQADSVCATVIGAYRTAREGRVTPAAIDLARTTMVRCVNNVDSTRRARSIAQVETQAANLASVLMDIPEYHDEGRLPAGNDAAGNPYLGPMAHIYASPNLGGFTRRAQIVGQSAPGLLVAFVVVNLGSGETLPASYRRLYLRGGLNCIWLNLSSSSPGTQYKAFVSQGTASGSCPKPTQTSPALDVVETRYGNRNHNDYPAAARFDTDVTGQPVLGLKCLDAYCEIGTTPQAVRRPTGLPSNPRRERVIKAWHDEQLLAVRGTDNIWRPSTVRATIVPEPNIDRYDAADFNQQWRHMADVLIHGSLSQGKYYDWGLREGANEVWLRYDGVRWQAQIRAPGASQGAWRIWTNVKRTVHENAAVPGTARFRWTVADDGIWVPCGNACCQADGT